MSTIIHNTTIVTADRDRSVYHDVAIVIEGDRIASIGPSDEALARFPLAELISGRGKAIMPGFANCHTHFTFTISRGVAENSSFSEHPDHDRAFGALWGPELADEELIVMTSSGCSKPCDAAQLRLWRYRPPSRSTPGRSWKAG